MNTDEMFTVLRVGKLPFEWSMRESEYDGDYIKGMTADHIKVRVIDRSKDEAKGRFAFEVYFPSLGGELADKRKIDFLDLVRKTVFPLIKAKEL